jgi:hypothetical protein
MLAGHEFEKRTILGFLNTYSKYRNDIPEQIRDKMDKLKINMNLDDKLAWEESLIDYLHK